MSRANILKTEHFDGKSHVTFQAHDGVRKYEYVGSAHRTLKRGKLDPSQLLGRLVEHKKDS